MSRFTVEGVPQKDLDLCISKVDELVKLSKSEGIDHWALRAALLKALLENADEYFASSKGTYREIAAFDNGVATTLESSKSHETR